MYTRPLLRSGIHIYTLSVLHLGEALPRAIYSLLIYEINLLEVRTCTNSEPCAPPRGTPVGDEDDTSTHKQKLGEAVLGLSPGTKVVKQWTYQPHI